MTWEQFCAEYQPGAYDLQLRHGRRTIEQDADRLQRLLAVALQRMDDRRLGSAA